MEEGPLGARPKASPVLVEFPAALLAGDPRLLPQPRDDLGHEQLERAPRLLVGESRIGEHRVEDPPADPLARLRAVNDSRARAVREVM